MVSADDLELSGILGLDFVNTVPSTGGPPMDVLERPEDFLDWMTLAGGGELRALAPSTWSERRTLIREAAALRRALRSLFAAVASRSAPSPATAFVVDRGLRAATASFSLSPPTPAETGDGSPRQAAGSGSSPRTPDPTPASPLGLWRTFQGRGPMAALAPIALSAVETATRADPDRLRVCDAPGCGRWFVDTSRGGQRRWCSMERCGNRMKAARYRARRADAT